jgi:hypothetical protein
MLHATGRWAIGWLHREQREDLAMKTYRARASIRARLDVVWKLLVDVRSWSRWNHTIERVDGTVEVGGALTLFTTVAPGRGFPVTVAEITPGQQMVFTGGLPLGLFRGRRTFTLRAGAAGRVEFETEEVFSGPLSPLITRLMPDLQPSFDAFAATLRNAAEKIEEETLAVA